jgi:hypothetical protein
MAMHSAVLLTEENRQLRSKNKRQKKKKTKHRAYIAIGGVLTVQEGLNQSQLVDTGPIEAHVDDLQKPRIRAPRTCSICRSLDHTTRTCPNKISLN